MFSYFLKFRPDIRVLVPALLGHLPYPRQVNAVKHVAKFGSIIRNGTFSYFLYDFYNKNIYFYLVTSFFMFKKSRDI